MIFSMTGISVKAEQENCNLKCIDNFSERFG